MTIETYLWDDLATFNHDAEWTANYVADSTVAMTEESVKAYLERYLADNDCNEDVRKLLRTFIDNRRLLEKTHVVTDGSYRNCVILVRPDGAAVVHTPFERQDDIYLALAWWVQDANIIHLNMTDETWKASDEYWSQFDDMDNWDYDDLD